VVVFLAFRYVALALGVVALALALRVVALLTSLVINTNLPPILHRLRVMVQFSLARGEYLTFTLSSGVILCQYRRK